MKYRGYPMLTGELAAMMKTKMNGGNKTQILNRQGDGCASSSHSFITAPSGMPEDNPLSRKGKKIMSNMKSQYGEKKAKKVFYASKNKGMIKGVD